MSRSIARSFVRSLLTASFVVTSLGLCYCAEPTRTPADTVPVNPGQARDVLQQFEGAQQLVKALGTFRATSEATDKKAILQALPNSDMFVYVLDAQAAAKLGLAFLSAEASKQSTIIVQEYAMYQDVYKKDKPNEVYRLGIGIRMF